MIEQVMIFALGFLVAGLAALAFAPAFWRRADRLTRRRLEMQMPLSVQEILAERDQLRAEFAVERCRLDQRVEHLTQRHAGDLAELGRRAGEIYSLNAELAEKAAAARAADLARAEMAQQSVAAEAELGALRKALYDADGLLDRRQDEFLEYVRLQESMKMLADIRFAALAASDARVASLELRLGDVSRNVLEAERKLAEKDRHARSLADVLANTRHSLDAAEARLATLQATSEAATSRAAQLIEELATLHQQHDADLSQLRTLMVRMNVNEAALEDARRREKDILAQRDQLTERARQAERGLLEKHVHLRSEYAAAQGALEVARRRCVELEDTLARRNATEAQKAAVPRGLDDEAMVRQSISEVGAAIVRLMRPPNGEAPASGAAALRLPTATVPAGLTKPDTASGSHAVSEEAATT